MSKGNYKEWSPLAMRIVAGIIFIVAGWAKIKNLSGTGTAFASMGIPLPAASATLVAVVELVGGLLLIVGFWTRWTAMLLGVVMIVASALMLSTGFQAAFTPLLVLAGMIGLALSGAGKLSIDEKLAK